MINKKFFDDLELRSKADRELDHLNKLNILIETAQNSPKQSERLSNKLENLSDLKSIDRKSVV